MKTILHDIWTIRFWRHLGINTFACGGFISAVLQLVLIVYPSLSASLQHWWVLALISAVSIVYGIRTSWPRPIVAEYNNASTKISVIEGDLLDQATDLVIGACNTFDTQPPNIIAPGSLQAQALNRLYRGDVAYLDQELARALSGKPTYPSVNKAGKQIPYDIGCVATLPQGGRRIYFVAYSTMDLNNNAQSSPDMIWKSLLLLWEEISRVGNNDAVSIPVIGGGPARLSNVLPAQDAIRFTILSFITASRHRKVCDELRIVVRPIDYQKLDRLELQAFLSSLRSS